jgi:hypothetical protein|tara:strand:+ start:259 stop:399 length:141 start_codon:yes stop_codon:yes gene_type:complete
LESHGSDVEAVPVEEQYFAEEPLPFEMDMAEMLSESEEVGMTSADQ